MKLRILGIATLLASALALYLATTSCGSDNDNNGEGGWYITNFDVANKAMNFDGEGVWEHANEASAGDEVSINGAVYSRFVNPARGAIYGFQPSRITNVSVAEVGIPGQNRGAIGFKPNANPNTYMTVCWDSTEPTDRIPLSPSCKMKLASGRTFYPISVSITNNAVTYAAMKDGIGMPAFTSTGNCKVYIIGVRDNEITGKVETVIGQGTNLGFDGMSKWTYVNLDDLGLVDYIYFQMGSTAGMNVTPPYFCLVGIEAYTYIED